MTKKPERKSEASRRADRIIQQRTLWLMGILGALVFVAVAAKLYDLQIVQHDKLEAKALTQQTRSTVVSASRGEIYDRNGNVLAISATAETIFASPLEVLNYYKDTYGDDYEGYYEQGKETLAEGLSGILGIDRDKILTKLGRTNSQYEILLRQADEDVADQVRQFLNDNELKGIYLVADTKRYYPYGALASHVIGFTNYDGDGAYGLEATYNDELQGTSGLVVSAKSGDGTDLLYQYEQYYDAKNGDSLVSTIDTTVQYYVEQGLQTLEDKFGTGHGATGIVMNVNTGALLAMASYPSYDLNDPRKIYDKELAEQLDGLADDAYNTKLGELQMLQWRNKTVNDTYEPGSTFKIITLATALEENVVNLNSTFTCNHSIRVPGYTEIINCSSKRGHGLQNLTLATANSCNPAYVTIGLKIGTSAYYKYLNAFGLLQTTGIELNGEAVGIAAAESDFNNLDLACYAFGQNINVTPVALIAAQAACINGGYLRTPYLVEQVLDSDGNVVSQHDSTPVRQVISGETSATVRQILEYVVHVGTGKNGQVAGYRIGGKTGTADKGQTGDVVVSFVCFAPADDPEVIMLMTLDTPSRSTGTYVSGGQMVAPTASAVMAEILPYLGVKSDTEETAVDTTVPNVVGLTKEEAETRLKTKELACRVVGSGDTVTDQTPVGGAIVPTGSSVVLYCGAQKPDGLCTVPGVVGLTPTQANKTLTDAGLIMKVTGASVSGSVFAISQSVAAESQVAAGTVVTVQFGDNTALD